MAAALTALSFSLEARGAPPAPVAEPDPLDVVLDGAVGDRFFDSSSGGGFLLGIEASVRMSDEERTTFGALAFVTVPLGRFGAPSRRSLTSVTIADKPREAPPIPGEEPPASASETPRIEPPKPSALTPELARGAVRAAWKAAGLDEAEQRLNVLSSRARSSALFPELRLRATRAIDESQSLAPTEYDPLRRTATGGSSTWLEARATFRLDRLLFADDEIAIERLRIARAAERAKLSTRVIDLLDAWQRAIDASTDATVPDEERRDAFLTAAASEAALDVLTSGWFSRALRARRANDNTASTAPPGASESASKKTKTNDAEQTSETETTIGGEAKNEPGANASGERMNATRHAPKARPTATTQVAMREKARRSNGSRDGDRDASTPRYDAVHPSFDPSTTSRNRATASKP